MKRILTFNFEWMSSGYEDLTESGDDIRSKADSFVKENWLPGGSVSVGTGFQFAEHYPEFIEDNFPVIDEVPRQIFDNFITPYNIDKPMHAAFSYGCAHYVIEGLNEAGLEENYCAKWAVVGTLAVAAGWFVKEQTMDNYADPGDMAANVAGASLAIMEDYYNWDLSEGVYNTARHPIESYNQLNEKVAEGFSWLDEDPEEILENQYTEDYLEED